MELQGYRHADLNAVTRDHVLEAIDECGKLGMHAFLEKHGYRPSAKYQLRYKGKSYPSKAILGVAAGLTNRDFFGGAAVVVRHLTRLGFMVREGRRRVTALGLLELARQANAEGRDGYEEWEMPELPVEPTSYFASGSNRDAEIRGMASVGQDVGVAAPDLHVSGLEELLRLAGTDIQVFVDSGAFAEFTGKKKPITNEEWVKRLGIYKTIANALHEQAWLVLPDKVGDQGATLARLERYKPILVELSKTGARLLAPIQKGEKTQVEFAFDVARVLEGVDWLPAFPCRMAATTAAELGAFLRAHPMTQHVHLLGLGPNRKKRGVEDGCADYLAHVARAGCSVSLDSMWIKGHSETGNAPSRQRARGPQGSLFGFQGKPRLYTWAQRVAARLLEGLKVLAAKGRELALILSFGTTSVLCTNDLDTE